ncbi:MAG: hypothetical protein V4692_16240 [Bdellovibrionota bacterium]
MNKKRAVVTISALNYSSRVEALAETFAKFHPGITFYSYVIDDPGTNSAEALKKTSGKPRASRAPKRINRTLADLNRFAAKQIPALSLQSMIFQYDVVEACTSIKPLVLLQLLLEDEYEEVLYLDPDIMICGSLNSVWKEFSKADVLLTPHLITFGNFTDSIVSERMILLSGTFNLGFIGVASSDNTIEFLAWWAQRLVRYSFRAVHQGLFTDQKWIDLALSAVEKVAILRDPGLNVAIWNIHERKVSRDSDQKYRVGKSLLKFFHFSGFDPNTPDVLNKFRSKIMLSSLGATKPLAKEYARLLKKHSHDKCSAIPYALNNFSNGIAIPEFLRPWTRSSPTFFDYRLPYDVNAENSFFSWLTAGAPGEIPGLIKVFRTYREDLQKAFPESEPDSDIRLKQWFDVQGYSEYPFDPRLVEIIRSSTAP